MLSEPDDPVSIFNLMSSVVITSILMCMLPFCFISVLIEEINTESHINRADKIKKSACGRIFNFSGGKWKSKRKSTS